MLLYTPMYLTYYRKIELQKRYKVSNKIVNFLSFIPYMWIITTPFVKSDIEVVKYKIELNLNGFNTEVNLIDNNKNIHYITIGEIKNVYFSSKNLLIFWPDLLIIESYKGKDFDIKIPIDKYGEIKKVKKLFENINLIAKYKISFQQSIVLFAILLFFLLLFLI